MRNTITLFMFLVFSTSLLSAQSSKVKNNPGGKWKFEAPYAPEGYNSGIIDISFNEGKYLTTISFTGSDYKIQGDKTKVEKDSVTFVVILEGNEVAISLKAEDDNKMTGKAVYFEGEIPLSLTKDTLKN